MKQRILIWLVVIVFWGYDFSMAKSICKNNEPGENSPDKLLLHYTFDKGDNKTVHNSTRYDLDGRIFGNVSYVPGRQGKALYFDGKTGYILLPDSKYLRIKGDMTIEGWLKPEELDKFIDDRLIIGHNAPLAVGRNYYLFLSKHMRYTGLLRFDHANGKQTETIRTDLPPFNGNWQHFAYVAEFPYQYFYIDGELVKRQKMELDITRVPGKGQYSVGGWANGDYGRYKGAMDDFKLYNTALSRIDIAESVNTNQVINPEVEISSDLSHLKKQLSVEVFVDGISDSTSVLRCRVMPAGSTGEQDIIEVTKSIEMTRPGSGRAVMPMTFELEEMKKGGYIITASVLDDNGKSLAESTHTHSSMGKPIWWYSTAGITDQVPAPWTQVEVKDDEDSKSVDVLVWGRTYSFTSFFPQKIVSKGSDILDSPITVTIETSEGIVEIVPDKPEILKRTPAAVDIKVSGKKDGITLLASHHIEYDGLIKTNWLISTNTDITVEQLRFEMPLKSDHAVYHYNSAYYDNFFGKPGGPVPIVPSGLLKRGKIFRPFTPMLSFLDDERGIQWLCESRRNWHNRDDMRAISVDKNSRRTVLAVHLVDKPLILKAGKTLDYTFGLMPGPMKPMGTDLWEHRVTGDGFGLYGNDYNWKDVSVNGMGVYEYYKNCGYRTIVIQGLNKIMGVSAPVGDEVGKMKELMAEIHRNGLWAIPYFGYQVSEISPEWTDFGRDALVIPIHRNSDSYPGWTPQFVNATCLNSYWKNHFIYTITKMVDDFGIDGVYLDTTTVPHLCENTNHGCGYIDEKGELQPTMPIFEIRDTLQRLYIEMKKRNPDAVIDIHASTSLCMPALAYATSLWSGEQLDFGRVEDPQDKLPLDRFRAEFMGKAWGIPSDLLPFNLCRYGTALGYALLHDTPSRPTGIDVKYPDLFSRTSKILTDFGRLESDWIPYWKNKGYVRTSLPKVYISLYKHPANGVLAVIMNLSSSSAQPVIVLNCKKLDLKRIGRVTDSFSSDNIPSTINSFSVDLPKFAWTIMHIK